MADRAVDVIETDTATAPGFRRAHARGIGVRGHFVASAEVDPLSVAEFLNGERIDAVVRLSNGSGNPCAPDRLSRRSGAVLGLAVEFTTPSGVRSTWAGANITSFPARTPQEFIAATVAQRPATRSGKPSLARLGWFLVRHRHLVRGFLAILMAVPTPSFATTRFNGLNTYYLVDRQGQRRAFRYRWIPDSGVARLSAKVGRSLPPEYLNREITQRLERGPVSWTLEFQLAQPGDPTDDLTRQWPASRQLVRAGRLTIDRLHEDQELVEGGVFDPTNVPAGIETSGDPVLTFRSAAYAESHRRRTAERGQGESPS